MLLNSANDINVIGSNIVSDNGTYLYAANDINILSSIDTLDQTYYNQVKTSGIFSSGGLSLTIGTSKNSLDSTYLQTTNSGSMVGSLNGDVTINAGEDYNQVASSVLAGYTDENGNFASSGDVDITAKSIDIEAGYDTYSGSDVYKSKQSGLTVALSSPAIGAVQSVVQNASDIGESKNARVDAMAAANTAYNAYKAYDVLTNPVNSDGQDRNALQISVSIGSSSSRSQSSYEGENAASSNIAGSNVSINATGAGENSDINVIGSNIAGSTLRVRR